MRLGVPIALTLAFGPLLGADLPLRINVRGPDWTGPDGRVWRGDGLGERGDGSDGPGSSPQYWSGDWRLGFNLGDGDVVEDLFGRPHPLGELFRTEAWSEATFTYEVDLPPGYYIVNLHLADTCGGCPNHGRGLHAWKFRANGRYYFSSGAEDWDNQAHIADTLRRCDLDGDPECAFRVGVFRSAIVQVCPAGGFANRLELEWDQGSTDPADPHPIVNALEILDASVCPHTLRCTMEGGTVTLTWVRGDVPAYSILREGVEIGAVPGNVGTFVDGDPPVAGTVRYQVVPLDTTACAPLDMSGCVVDLGPCPAPQEIACTALGGGAVEVSWAATEDAAGFEVLRDGETIATLEGTETGYTDTEVSGIHSYEVRFSRTANCPPMGGCVVAAGAPIRINAQGPDLVLGGNEWLGDPSGGGSAPVLYSGDWHRSAHGLEPPILDPYGNYHPFEDLYATEAWGGEGPMFYTFEVPAGSYIVNLYMADTCNGCENIQGPGTHAWKVRMNGAYRLGDAATDHDNMAYLVDVLGFCDPSVDGPRCAFRVGTVRSTTLDVPGEGEFARTIEIAFDQGSLPSPPGDNNPIVNGIEILDAALCPHGITCGPDGETIIVQWEGGAGAAGHAILRNGFEIGVAPPGAGSFVDPAPPPGMTLLYQVVPLESPFCSPTEICATSSVEPPTIDDVPEPQWAIAGKPYCVELVVTGIPFPDLELLGGPAGASVDPTGLVQWTPALGDAGAAVEFEVRASNVAGAVTEAWSVDVLPEYVDPFDEDPLVKPEWIVDLPGPDLPEISQGDGKLRVRLPAGMDFDHWAGFDRMPKLKRTDVTACGGDWVIETRVEQVNPPSDWEHYGLLVQFGPNDMVMFGPHRRDRIVAMEPTGCGRGGCAGAGSMPWSESVITLRIERDDGVYRFLTRRSDGDPWSFGTERPEAQDPAFVGVFAKNWGGGSAPELVVEFDYFKIKPFVPPPADLTCRVDGLAVLLDWTNNAEYEKILVTRNGVALAELGGGETSFLDRPLPCPGSEYAYGVHAVFNGDFITPAGCTVAFLSMVHRLNCKGDSFTDDQGNFWLGEECANDVPGPYGDRPINCGGNNFPDPKQIINETRALNQLYHDEGWYGADFGYDFPVPAGEYQVRLFLGDMYTGNIGYGARTFKVVVQGEYVLGSEPAGVDLDEDTIPGEDFCPQCRAAALLGCDNTVTCGDGTDTDPCRQCGFQVGFREDFTVPMAESGLIEVHFNIGTQGRLEGATKDPDHVPVIYGIEVVPAGYDPSGCISGLSAELTAEGLVLSWDPGTGTGEASVYRDGELVAEGVTGYTDPEPVPGVFQYTVYQGPACPCLELMVNLCPQNVTDMMNLSTGAVTLEWEVPVWVDGLTVFRDGAEIAALVGETSYEDPEPGTGVRTYELVPEPLDGPCGTVVRLVGTGAPYRISAGGFDGNENGLFDRDPDTDLPDEFDGDGDGDAAEIVTWQSDEGFGPGSDIVRQIPLGGVDATEPVDAGWEATLVDKLCSDSLDPLANTGRWLNSGSYDGYVYSFPVRPGIYRLNLLHCERYCDPATPRCRIGMVDILDLPNEDLGRMPVDPEDLTMFVYDDGIDPPEKDGILDPELPLFSPVDSICPKTGAPAAERDTLGMVSFPEVLVTDGALEVQTTTPRVPGTDWNAAITGIEVLPLILCPTDILCGHDGTNAIAVWTNQDDYDGISIWINGSRLPAEFDLAGDAETANLADVLPKAPAPGAEIQFGVIAYIGPADDREAQTACPVLETVCRVPEECPPEGSILCTAEPEPTADPPTTRITVTWELGAVGTQGGGYSQIIVTVTNRDPVILAGDATSHEFLCEEAEAGTMLLVDVVASRIFGDSDCPALACEVECPVLEPQFKRGDCILNGTISLSDAIQILLVIFRRAEVECLEACDVDNSGRLTITDAVGLLAHFFNVPGAQPPKPPYPECGPDPDVDDTDCPDLDPRDNPARCP